MAMVQRTRARMFDGRPFLLSIELIEIDILTAVLSEL